MTAHPDELLASLLAKGGRAQRQRNLNELHRLCRDHHASGSKDFAIPTIGKLCEQAGLLKGRALYNAPSADYRALIQAWSEHAGPSEKKAAQPPRAYHDLLTRIADPALRALVQAVVFERDRLRAQLNTLKAHTNIIIDRRPLPGTLHAHESGTVTVVRPTPLTESERQALEKAVSVAFLVDQGWKEIEHGEVVNQRGRTVFDPGFATAIRKFLGSI